MSVESRSAALMFIFSVCRAASDGKREGRCMQGDASYLPVELSVLGGIARKEKRLQTTDL